MSDGFFHKYFINNGGKEIHKWYHYFDIYERHFSRFRGKAPVVLEIGVAAGGSLEMWKQYFGPGSRILGLDINPECKRHEQDGMEIFIGSQADASVFDLILEKYPRIDIVIDDGSHMQNHMVRSFELLYERVDPNGLYIVEDTHTCYWPEFQGGYKAAGSFVELAKNKIDELNAVHARGAVAPSRFTRSTDSITCYDSVVVFERRAQGKRQSMKSHGMD